MIVPHTRLHRGEMNGDDSRAAVKVQSGEVVKNKMDTDLKEKR